MSKLTGVMSCPMYVTPSTRAVHLFGSALATLPSERTPNKADWDRIARAWRPRLDAQIDALVGLRDQLTECIGCDCLSLRGCALYNPEDRAARLGNGPRFLLGDLPEDVPTD